jgi:hypothetical protein
MNMMILGTLFLLFVGAFSFAMLFIFAETITKEEPVEEKKSGDVLENSGSSFDLKGAAMSWFRVSPFFATHTNFVEKEMKNKNR